MNGNGVPLFPVFYAQNGGGTDGGRGETVKTVPYGYKQSRGGIRIMGSTIK